MLLNAAPELRAARHLFAETERQQETLGEAEMRAARVKRRLTRRNIGIHSDTDGSTGERILTDISLLYTAGN